MLITTIAIEIIVPTTVFTLGLLSFLMKSNYFWFSNKMTTKLPPNINTVNTQEKNLFLLFTNVLKKYELLVL